MNPKIGARFRSVVCDTEVIVVRPIAEDVDLRCGGHPMIGMDDAPSLGAALDPEFAGGTALGKRYVDLTCGLELLCTKPGKGTLSVSTEPLTVKDAKPLPSSD